MAGGVESILARFHSVYLSKCHVLPIVSKRRGYKKLTKHRCGQEGHFPAAGQALIWDNTW